jgi:DNA polymerase-3 subunit gamma/tau
VAELLNLIIVGDKNGVVDKLDWFHAMSTDYGQLLEELSRLLHEIALTQSLNKVTGGGAFEVSTLKSMAQQLSEQRGQLYYQFVVVGLEQMRSVPDKKISFEMTIIRMLDFDIDSDANRPAKDNQLSHQQAPSVPNKQRVETNKAHHSQIDSSNQASANNSQVNNKPETQPDSKPLAEYVDLSKLNNDNWPQIFKDLPLKGMARELARNLMVLENNNNTIIFALDASVESFKKQKLLDKLSQVLSADKQNYQLQFCVKEGVDSVAKKQADADRKMNQKRQQDIDPVVEGLQKQFNATIINEKIG